MRARGGWLTWFSALCLACGASTRNPPQTASGPARRSASVPSVGALAPSAASSSASSARAAPAPTASTPPTLEAPSLPAVAIAAAVPIAFEDAARDGRWIVSCQARSDSNADGRIEVSVSPAGDLLGDRLGRYLTFANGEERAIDDLLAASADGRWLVLMDAGKSELFDAVTRSAVVDLSELGADIRRDPAERKRHRTLVFSERALYYVRTRGNQNEVVERVLVTGLERTLYSCQDPVVSLELDAGEKALIVRLPGADANGNGRFDWPRKPEASPKACASPLARFIAPNPNADPLAAVVVSLESGGARKLDDLATVFGNGVVRRALDGALWLEQGTRTSVIADKDCSGRILFEDPVREQFLIGCALPKRPGRLGVELVGRGARRALDIDVAWLAFDEPTRAPTRLIPLYPGADCALFDSEHAALDPLQTGDQVLLSHGARALIRRQNSLVLFDADAHAESPLPGTLAALGVLLRQDPLVFASPLLIDVDAGRVLGRVAGRALFVTTGGRVLVPESPPTASALARGPLSWKSAE